MLFGVGYGTGVRIGYEQVYPLLFPKANASNIPNSEQVRTNLKSINKIYDTIGGKEASNMGIAQGLNSVRSSTENNPDFQYLEELESKMSGRTPSNLDPHNKSSTGSSALQVSSELYSFEWIADFKDRIKLADRVELRQWLAILEQDPEKLSSDDTAHLLLLINNQLGGIADTTIEGHTATEAFKTQFITILQQLPVSDLKSMYNNRFKFDNWQQALIIKEFNLRGGIPDKKVSVYDTKRQQYITSRDKQLKKIKAWKERLRNTPSVIKTSSRQTGRATGTQRANPALKTTAKTLARLQKTLINFITRARNEINTKSLANNDWNKRIWK